MSAHTTHETALLEGRHSPELDAHLVECDACAALRDELAAVQAAAADDTGSPAGLADRIIDAVRTQDSGVTALADAPSKRRLADPLRGRLLRSTAIAAALLLLVGVVALLDDGEEPLDTVLISAERTDEAGPMQVNLEGSARVEVAVDQSAATRADARASVDWSGLPDEWHAHVEARFNEMMERWEQAMAEFERQVDETLDRAGDLIDEQMRQLEEQMDGFGDSFGAQPPPAPPSRPRESAEPPTDAEQPRPTPGPLELVFDIRAAGTADFGSHLYLAGSVASAGGGTTDFSVSAEGDERSVSAAGTDAAGSGVLARLLASPTCATDLLRAATSAERDGTEVVLGTELDRYQLTLDPTRLGVDSAGEWTATALIDDDGLLHRLDLDADGSLGDGGATWGLDLTFDLPFAGSVVDSIDVVVAPPSATFGSEPGAQVFGPFLPAFTASLGRP